MADNYNLQLFLDKMYPFEPPWVFVNSIVNGEKLQDCRDFMDEIYRDWIPQVTLIQVIGRIPEFFKSLAGRDLQKICVFHVGRQYYLHQFKRNKQILFNFRKVAQKQKEDMSVIRLFSLWSAATCCWSFTTRTGKELMK